MAGWPLATISWCRRWQALGSATTESRRGAPNEFCPGYVRGGGGSGVWASERGPERRRGATAPSLGVATVSVTAGAAIAIGAHASISWQSPGRLHGKEHGSLSERDASSPGCGSVGVMSMPAISIPAISIPGIAAASSPPGIAHATALPRSVVSSDKASVRRAATRRTVVMTSANLTGRRIRDVRETGTRRRQLPHRRASMLTIRA